MIGCVASSALFPKVTINRASCEPVQDHAAEKLGVIPLDLLNLCRDVPGQADVELHGTRLPHASHPSRSLGQGFRIRGDASRRGDQASVSGGSSNVAAWENHRGQIERTQDRGGKVSYHIAFP